MSNDVKIDLIAKVTGGAAEDLDKIAKAATGVEKATKDAETATKEWEAAGTKAATAATKSWENTRKAIVPTTQGIKDAGVAVLATAAALAAATVAGAVANERQQRALTALGGAYGEVQRATNGTVTATEAWRVQQSLLQSGLPTTGRELALITRAARDYAQATGTETPAAIEQLTQALVNGEAGGLRRFGLSVQQGATRTATFDSALQQLQRTQASSIAPARTLGEEIEHFGTQATEAGAALAGFLLNAAGGTDTLRVLSDQVHRNVSALTEFTDFMGRSASNGSTAAVTGRIGGVRASTRPRSGPTAAQQALIDAGNAAGQRAAQAAIERANQPAAAGPSGPSLAERQETALQQVLIRTRTETLATENAEKARVAAWVASAAQLDELGTAAKNATVARAIAEHEAIDSERRGRTDLLSLAVQRRDAELALADAEGHGDSARRDRIGELSTLREALQGMLAETTARIEAAQAEHATQEEMNALLRERIGIQQSLAQTTTQLTEVQRANGAALREFRDAMVQQASGVADAFGAATVAALDSQQSFAAALGAALREQLKALTKEAVVMSLKNLALGTAALFTNPAAAPAFFGAAGLWGAVGIAAGGITAATSAPKAATPSSGSAGGDRAASASAARAPSEAGGPLTLQINVSGAMFNEGVEESIVRGLDRAHARGLSPRFARGLA